MYFLGTFHNPRPLELPTSNVYLLEHTSSPRTLHIDSVYLLVTRVNPKPTELSAVYACLVLLKLKGPVCRIKHGLLAGYNIIFITHFIFKLHVCDWQTISYVLMWE